MLGFFVLYILSLIATFSFLYSGLRKKISRLYNLRGTFRNKEEDSLYCGRYYITGFDLLGLFFLSFTPALNTLTALFLTIYHGVEWLSQPVDFINDRIGKNRNSDSSPDFDPFD